MQWTRRRDLEGGKELGVWLLENNDRNVETELYVETHEYRDDGFDVHTAENGEWEKKGTFDDQHEAFELALSILEESPHTYKKL